MDFSGNFGPLEGFRLEMRNHPTFKVLLGCLGSALILAGCNSSSGSQPITPTTVISTLPQVTQLPTHPAAPSATISPTPSPTPARPTSSPTETLQPTLTSEKREEAVSDLLRNNAGCQLPCWWGLTPGETSWESAQEFLSPFIGNLHTYGKQVNIQFADIRIPTSEKLSPTGLIFLDIMIKDGVIEHMEVYNYDWPSYHLAEFLATHGKPDEVWVHTLKTNLGGPPPFALMLFYLQDGFSAYFFARESESHYHGTTIQACITDSPTLFLWSTNKKISIQEFGEMFDDDYVKDKPILPLEKAIGMDVNRFYQSYKNTDTLPCFQTNRELWPEP